MEGRDPQDQGSEKAFGDQKEDRGDSDVGRFEGDQHGSSPDVGSASDDVRESARKAFEARDTQDASRSEGGAIYAPEPGAEKVGESVTEGGEERASKHKEPGRVMDESDTGEKDSGGQARPAGKSTARFSTGVDPQDPKEGPGLPTGDQGG